MKFAPSVAIVFALGVAASRTVAATPEETEKAIRKGAEYVYTLQNEFGNWEPHPVRPTIIPYEGDVQSQWGGTSALSAYALLAAGERSLDPRMVKATDWLRTAKIDGNYALGVRANVWLNLPTTLVNLNAMRAEGKRLGDGVYSSDKLAGLYTYKHYDKPNYNYRVDLSCSQYGVLGMWAVAQFFEDGVPSNYWQMVDSAWRKLQQADGGWAYMGTPSGGYPETIQITAAGVATLFITQEFLHTSDGIEGTKGNIFDPAITKGLAYITAELPKLLEGCNTYALYGVERIGVASGYKYLGDIDWFQAGADRLIKSQGPDGSIVSGYGQPVATDLGLLFLSRGRAPVMMNKLEYDIGDKPGNWNQRPRDVANATRWIDSKIERRLNWQIIDLKHDVLRDLHDSNILYIAGNQALNFTDEQKAMLKQYVQEGGLILGTADANRPEFSKSFRDLGKALFPDYEFKPIDDKTHGPLMSEQFPASKWKRKLRIEALSNNARYLMILLPDGDAGRIFQRRDTNHPETFEFFANLFLYSIDKTDAHYKGETHIVREDPAVTPTTAITVARLKYNGRWDPEPAGWNRLTAVMQRDDDVKLEVKTCELGKDSLAGVKIAHLTGVDKFTLTPAERSALADFVKGGGLLVIDACGGLDSFNGSAQSELSQIFPEAAAQLAVPLKKDSPLYTAGGELKAKYRQYTLIERPSGASGFRLNGVEIGGKLGVIYSSDDLSEGLVGQSVDGIIGYTPEVATKLMAQIITLKNAGKI